MPDVTPNSQASSGAANPVAAIAALLDAERVIPDANPEKTEPEEVAQPVEDAAEPAQNAQVEGEDAQPDEGEKTPVAEIPLEQLEAIELEVTVQGEKKKLPIKALREGYMRQEDYSKKTAEVARQREEVGEKVRQAIDGERNGYQESLKNLQALVLESVAPELKNVDWNHLAANDPFEYVRLQNRSQQIQKTLAEINAKGTELSTKQKAEQSQALQKVAREARATLEADIPGFNDDLYQKLITVGVEAGYKPEVVSQWTDPQAFKLLHKAYLYDQLKAGKPAESKKVVVAPTAIKPGATATVTKQAQRQGKALDSLRKTGNVNDLAAFLSSSMK